MAGVDEWKCTGCGLYRVISVSFEVHRRPTDGPEEDDKEHRRSGGKSRRAGAATILLVFVNSARSRYGESLLNKTAGPKSWIRRVKSGQEVSIRAFVGRALTVFDGETKLPRNLASGADHFRQETSAPDMQRSNIVNYRNDIRVSA